MISAREKRSGRCVTLQQRKNGAVGKMLQVAEMEAYVLQNLSKQSGIVRCIGSFVSKPDHFIVLDEARFSTCRDVALDRLGLREDQPVILKSVELVALTLSAVETLCGLHGRAPAVVHCGISPQSIIMSVDLHDAATFSNIFKLKNFSNILFVGGSNSGLQDSIHLDRYFAAPELLSKLIQSAPNVELTAAVDVWSLGATLLSLSIGVQFSEQLLSRLMNVRNSDWFFDLERDFIETLASIHQSLWSQAHPLVKHVILQSLVLNPSDRPSAAALRDSTLYQGCALLFNDLSIIHSAAHKHLLALQHQQSGSSTSRMTSRGRSRSGSRTFSNAVQPQTIEDVDALYRRGVSGDVVAVGVLEELSQMMVGLDDGSVEPHHLGNLAKGFLVCLFVHSASTLVRSAAKAETLAPSVSRWLDGLSDEAIGQEEIFIAAMLCFHGLGRSKDLLKVKDLLLQCGQAVGGYAPAQFTLGALYYSGELVATRPDFAAAFHLFCSAAFQNYAPAQYSLGRCFEEGHGVASPSPQMAGQCYLASAQQGYAEAQCRLGLMHAADPKLAFDWLLKAAVQGKSLAQYHVGQCYEFGTAAVPLSFAEAVKWYQAAASQGFGLAQLAIGNCYRHTKGVPEDLAEAIRWYKEAEKNGVLEAGVMIAQVGAMLTV